MAFKAIWPFISHIDSESQQLNLYVPFLPQNPFRPRVIDTVGKLTVFTFF